MKGNVSIIRYVLLPAVIVALIVSIIVNAIAYVAYFRKLSLRSLDVISKFCTNLMGDFLITVDGIKRR